MPTCDMNIDSSYMITPEIVLFVIVKGSLCTASFRLNINLPVRSNLHNSVSVCEMAIEQLSCCI